MGGRARRLDRDNLYGGCKPLIDALKKEGVIVDDCPKWCDLDIEEDRSPVGEALTIVHWEDVPSEEDVKRSNAKLKKAMAGHNKAMGSLIKAVKNHREKKSGDHCKKKLDGEKSPGGKNKRR